MSKSVGAGLNCGLDCTPAVCMCHSANAVDCGLWRYIHVMPLPFYFMPCSINGGRSLNLQTVGNRNFRNKILTILKVTETHDWKTLLLYLLVYVTRKKQTPFRFLAVSIACCVYAGINLREMSSHPLQAYIQYSSVALWLLAFVRNFNMWLWFIVIISPCICQYVWTIYND